MAYLFNNKKSGDIDYCFQILPFRGKFSYFENFNNWITIDLHRSLFGVVIGKKCYWTSKMDRHVFIIFQFCYFDITF